MDLIYQQDGALPVVLAPFLCFADHPPDVGHAGHHRIQRLEVRARAVGDDARQGGLARPRRPPEDDRAKQPVGFNRAAQQLSRPDDVLLTDELIQRARAHAGSQRRFNLLQLGSRIIKEVAPHV
jgi:hypothetical protein